MPKVLIVTGDAAESLEVMYPYQRLLEEGYQVDIAAPSVKKLQFVAYLPIQAWTRSVVHLLTRKFLRMALLV